MSRLTRLAVMLRRRMEWALLAVFLLTAALGAWGFWLFARPPPSFVTVTVFTPAYQVSQAGVVLVIERVTWLPDHEVVKPPRSLSGGAYQAQPETAFVEGTLRNENESPLTIASTEFGADGTVRELTQFEPSDRSSAPVPLDLHPLVRHTVPPSAGLADCPRQPGPGIAQYVLGGISETRFSIRVTPEWARSASVKTAQSGVLEQLRNGHLPPLAFAPVIPGRTCDGLSEPQLILTTEPISLGAPVRQDYYPFGWPSCEGGEISPDGRMYWVPWRFMSPDDRHVFRCP